jgi:glycine oxidase
VVGATVEEQGFDTRPTAGAVHDLLRAALELLPDVAELELAETVVGLRPGSPDNAPILGPAGPEGLVVATGHYRNGILLTPVTADAIAELLATGRVPDLIAPFGPDRFAATGPDRFAATGPDRFAATGGAGAGRPAPAPRDDGAPSGRVAQGGMGGSALSTGRPSTGGRRLP